MDAPRPQIVLAAAVLTVALYATLLLPRSTVAALVQEDGPFEYAGALGLLATSLLFVAGYVRLRRADPGAATGIWKRRSLLVLALVFFVGAGEEVSWGQRLFGIGTPEGLAGANVQGETNLHNLQPVTGMSYQLFLIGWYSFAVLAPLAAALWRPARRRLERLIPLVPLPLGALFLLNYVTAQVALVTLPVLDALHARAVESARVVEGALGEAGVLVLAAVYPINRDPVAEITELAVSLLAALTAWTVLRRLAAREPASAGSPGPPAARSAAG